jgi:hypothetical protein
VKQKSLLLTKKYPAVKMYWLWRRKKSCPLSNHQWKNKKQKQRRRK